MPSEQDDEGIDRDRDLRTSTTTIFGDVRKGTDCRVCGRDVDDGRAKYCSDRCREIMKGVRRMLNWGGVRRRVKERDEHTCQECGISQHPHRRARSHIIQRVDELTRDLKPPDGEFDWEARERWYRARSEMRGRYNIDEAESIPLEVDHIERVADGGAVFDESNLQTLCEDCHRDKTAEENSTTGGRHPEDLETLTLDDYLVWGEQDA